MSSVVRIALIDDDGVPYYRHSIDLFGFSKEECTQFLASMGESLYSKAKQRDIDKLKGRTS